MTVNGARLFPQNKSTIPLYFAKKSTLGLEGSGRYRACSEGVVICFWIPHVLNMGQRRKPSRTSNQSVGDRLISRPDMTAGGLSTAIIRNTRFGGDVFGDVKVTATGSAALPNTAVNKFTATSGAPLPPSTSVESDFPGYMIANNRGRVFLESPTQETVVTLSFRQWFDDLSGDDTHFFADFLSNVTGVSVGDPYPIGDTISVSTTMTTSGSVSVSVTNAGAYAYVWNNTAGSNVSAEGYAPSYSGPAGFTVEFGLGQNNLSDVDFGSWSASVSVAGGRLPYTFSPATHTLFR